MQKKQPSESGGGTVAAPQYRYREQISKLKKCPRNADQPFDDSCYRIVHQDIAHPDNFLPKAVLEPHYIQERGTKDCCLAWGLSLWENLQQIRTRVSGAAKSAVRLRLKLGYYAELNLTAQDGRRTKAGEKGHFTFYEYDTFDAKARVKDHGPL